MTYTPTPEEMEAERARLLDLRPNYDPPDRVVLAGIISQRQRAGLEPYAEIEDPAETRRVANRERQRRYRERKRQSANHAARDSRLRRTYGISAEDFDTAHARRKGRCDICGRRHDRRHNGGRLYVDHDHDTGEIRGLLCSTCNSTLGRAGDTAESLRRLLAYVENPPGLD